MGLPLPIKTEPPNGCNDNGYTVPALLLPTCIPCVPTVAMDELIANIVRLVLPNVGSKFK